MVAAVTTVTVVILVVLVGSDLYLRNREMGHLLNATEASEQSMNDYISEERRIVKTAPRTTTDQDADAVRSDLQVAASDAAAQVLTTGDDVRDVFVVPWHRALTRAQDRYLAHSDAWLRMLESGARDYAKLAGPHPQISGTFLSAEKAYRDAIPPLALNNARSRVEAIFAE